MLSPLLFPGFNSLSLVSFLVKPVCDCSCPILSVLAFGKLPENPVVTPGTSVQVVRPSSVNRFLQSVTVKATTPPTP
jgi:hypothetical protein